MATEITVAAGYIPCFTVRGYTPAAGDTVSLVWKLTSDGLDDDGVPRLKGSGPVVACTVYAWDSVDGRFEDAAGVAMPAFSPALGQYDGPFALYIPAFAIDPTSDWLRPRPGRYNVSFRTPDGTEKRWLDFSDIVVPIDPNPIRLLDINLFSKGGVSGFGYEEAYTKEETDAKITAALVAGFANPMTAIGDMIYGGTVALGLAAPTRLPATTNGFFMKLAAGLPAWAALSSLEVTTALTFTPENAANKNAASGYAGLSAGSKVALAQLQEVLGLADMTDVAGGAVPTNGHFLKGNGTAWANAALASGDITAALTFTPENAANKNAASGYAGLSAGSKVALAQLQEVLGLADMTDVAGGAVPTNGHFLKGNGTAWANAALASGDITAALTFTPENAANRNAASGYAGLNATGPSSGNPLAYDGSNYGPVTGLTLTSLITGLLKGVAQVLVSGSTTALAAAAFIVYTDVSSNLTTVLTLTAASGQEGRLVIVCNNNPSGSGFNMVTVNCDGADVFVRSGATSSTISVGAGEVCVLVCSGANSWNYLLDL